METSSNQTGKTKPVQHFSAKRILLKLSGESLAGKMGQGIDMQTIARIAEEIRQAVKTGTEICLVVGGGNIFRGLAGAANGMDRAEADYMGMLATVINALALSNSLRILGLDARVMSAIPMPTICEPFTRERALSHLCKNRVLILAAGSGNPFFTTDTAAALRAAELKCSALFKATDVDGVYEQDPKTHPNAKRYTHLNYMDVLAKNINVMDATAVTLARGNAIPIIVFSIETDGLLQNILIGKGQYTLIDEKIS